MPSVRTAGLSTMTVQFKNADFPEKQIVAESFFNADTPANPGR